MALIKCPECGRENVSDNAESCPTCGYGIKNHFEKERRREVHQRKINSITMPEKPEKSKLKLFDLVWMIFPIFFVLISFGAFATGQGGAGVACLFIGIFMYSFLYYIFILQDYNKKMDKYNRAMQDFEKYKRDEVREQEIRVAEQAAKPKCPHCNSTNIERISTTSRAVSVATVGLASGKIGKQYQCKNCKHMW